MYYTKFLHMILQENKETVSMINFVAKSVFGLKKKYPIGKNCKETLTKIALYSGPILSIKSLLVADCLYGFGENCKETLLSIKVL